MGGCSAENCTNHSRNKFRMFKFPADAERRKIWISNCRREEWTPGPRAELCIIHFEENQFELHRQDGWKKLKPNAVPTLFPEPPVNIKKERKEKAAARKRKSSVSAESEVQSKKSARKRNLANQETASYKKKKVTRKKGQLCLSLQKKKRGSDTSQSQQKENVYPRGKSAKKGVKQESSSGEEMESEDDEAEQQIALLKRDNESMKQEIQEFEKHNRAMSRVILELEKANKAMSMKLQELDKDNRILTKKVSDLERLNEDLKSKLNCCFSEEQLARMDKMRQLGKIERYIPAIK